MRIGDTIQAGLNSYDPSPYLRASGQAAQSIGNSISQGVGAIGSAIDRRAEYKTDVKMGKELAKAMKTLHPELAKTLDPYLAELENDENPLSHQAALGKGVGTVISQYIGERDSVFERSLRERGMDINERGMILDESRHDYDVKALDRAIAEQDQSKLDASQTNALISDAFLDKLIGQTDARSKAGKEIGFPVEVLETARGMNPNQRLAIVKAALDTMPQDFRGEINYNTPVTIDGQAGTMPTRTNADGSISPVAWGDGSGGASINQEVATDPIKGEIAKTAAKYGIPPAHALSIVAQESNFDPNTTMESSSAKGLFQFLDADRKQYGVGTDSPLSVQIDAGMRKMKDNYDATKKALGREPTAGELYTTYYQGIGAGPAILSNPKGSFRDTLNKFGENHANKVIGANPWLAGVSTNEEFVAWSEQKMKEKGFIAPTVTPGAVKSGSTQTPVQQAIDEANLAKAKGDVAAQQAAEKKSQSANQSTIAGAEEAISLMGRIPKHKGFGEAVGAGLYKSVGAIPFVPDDWTPAGSDKAGAVALITQLKSKAFLESIQQMKGFGALSNMEGEKLDAAAVRLDRAQSEEDFKAALTEYKSIVQGGIDRMKWMTATGTLPAAASATAPAQSASEMLRSLKR